MSCVFPTIVVVGVCKADEWGNTQARVGRLKVDLDRSAAVGEGGRALRVARCALLGVFPTVVVVCARDGGEWGNTQRARAARCALLHELYLRARVAPRVSLHILVKGDFGRVGLVGYVRTSKLSSTYACRLPPPRGCNVERNSLGGLTFWPVL